MSCRPNFVRPTRGPADTSRCRAVACTTSTRDPATLALRQAENSAWSAAPPAKQANVYLRLPYDSYVFGTTAPPQQWPEWQGRPTIVGGVELATRGSARALVT